MKMTAENKQIMDFFGFILKNKKVYFKEKELNELQLKRLKEVMFILDYHFEVKEKNLYMFNIFKYMKENTQLNNKEIIDFCFRIINELIVGYKMKEFNIGFPVPKAIENLINSLKAKQPEFSF